MYGWHHKLLRVDLTNQKVSIEDIDPQTSRDYIGGRGVAMRYLYDEVDPQVNPLAPENKLISPVDPVLLQRIEIACETVSAHIRVVQAGNKSDSVVAE